MYDNAASAYRVKNATRFGETKNVYCRRARFFIEKRCGEQCWRLYLLGCGHLNRDITRRNNYGVLVLAGRNNFIWFDCGFLCRWRHGCGVKCGGWVFRCRFYLLWSVLFFWDTHML